MIIYWSYLKLFQQRQRQLFVLKLQLIPLSLYRRDPPGQVESLDEFVFVIEHLDVLVVLFIVYLGVMGVLLHTLLLLYHLPEVLYPLFVLSALVHLLAVHLVGVVDQQVYLLHLHFLLLLGQLTLHHLFLLSHFVLEQFVLEVIVPSPLIDPMVQ